jgi:hypothetical protein
MSTISAGTNLNTALNYSADTTGNLVLQSGSSANTALTLDSSQNATFTGNVSVRTSGGTYTDVAKGVAKAWVNFNGTLSGTITPRASFNVASVTKNNTGDYTLNFTTAMPDTNYVTLSMCSTDSDNPTIVNLQGTTGAATTSSVRIQNSKQSNGASADRTVMCVSVFSS